MIDCRDRTIRLVAPAGSGKTQTMVNRVLTRIKEGLAPDRILLLTFDRSAAGSLEHSLANNVAHIESTVGTQVNVRGMSISTLNAFGYGLLRKSNPEEAKTIATSDMQHRIIREALDGLQTKSYERYSLLPPSLQRRYYLDFFSYLKNQLHDPRKVNMQAFADLILTSPQAFGFFSDEPDKERALKIIQAVHWLFTVQEKLLQNQHVMDFDDQKLRAYVTLMDRPDVLRALQGRYSEVVVDEFQDIEQAGFRVYQTGV